MNTFVLSTNSTPIALWEKFEREEFPKRFKLMTAHRAPLKEGDTVYLLDKKVRGKVLGRLKYLVLLEIEGTHEKLKEHRGDLKLIHPKMSKF